MPLPLTRPVIAMPSSAPVSTSLTEPPSNVEIWIPPLPMSSSVIVGRLGAAGVSTGASLTAVTVMSAVSVAVENAADSAVGARVDLRAGQPLVWSQARKVKLAVSAFSPSGTKRM